MGGFTIGATEVVELVAAEPVAAVVETPGAVVFDPVTVAEGPVALVVVEERGAPGPSLNAA